MEDKIESMKNLSKKLTGKKIRDEMRRRKMTVRDLQDALELDSPQSIYKWLRGESFPSLPNMLVLGELFQVPLETLLIREAGFPYHIGLLFQEKDDFSSNRRSKARSDLFAGNYYTKAFTHSQEHPDPEVPHN